MMRAPVVLLVITACAAPHDGALLCGADPRHPCPSGFKCVEGRCYNRDYVFVDMSAGINDSDMAIAYDLSAAWDLTSQYDLDIGGDMTAFSFYPELQRQVEAYGCRMSGCHDTTAPILSATDTRLHHKNYDALLPFASPALIERLRPGRHGGGISDLELLSWQYWVTNPAL